MRRYLLLAISIVLSIVVFVLTIVLQKRIIGEEKYIPIYAVNTDVIAYDEIDESKLYTLYIKENEIQKDKYVYSIDEVSGKVVSKDYFKGMPLLKSDLLVKENVVQNTENAEFELISIPIDNIDSVISNYLTRIRPVNVYITINEKFVPEDIDVYDRKTSRNRDEMIFVYLKNIVPIAFYDNKGKEVKEDRQMKYLVFKVDKEKAMYINYIKDIAKFNITVL